MLDLKTLLMIAPLVALLLAVAYGPLTSHADPVPRAHLKVVDPDPVPRAHLEVVDPGAVVVTEPVRGSDLAALHFAPAADGR